MRVFKSKEFARFARKSRIGDPDLCRAVSEIMAGSADADLGGGVFKQRLRRKGQGKSGGFRTILLLRWSSLAIFVYGFAKSDRPNITSTELAAWRKIAENLLGLQSLVEDAVEIGTLIEVACDE